MNDRPQSEDNLSVEAIAETNAEAPAYPWGQYVQGGATKRELFAAMAMQGAIASGQLRGPSECISYALQCADALLKELAK